MPLAVVNVSWAKSLVSSSPVRVLQRAGVDNAEMRGEQTRTPVFGGIVVDEVEERMT
ncbi:hypothetical protein BH24ACT15_BH24ACT15_34450 [soil metagenome]